MPDTATHCGRMVDRIASVVAVAATLTSGGGNRCPQSGHWRTAAARMLSQSGQILVGGAPSASLGPLRRDGIDRPVPGDVAGKVEHQAVLLAGREPGAAAGHLHVEAGGFGRAQHGDQIDRRRVEAGGEHAHRGERPDLAALEGGDDAIALGRGRVAEDGGARDAALADRLRHVSGVRDAGAEHQPGPPALAVGQHLVDRGLGDRIAVDGGLQLPGDELAAAAADTADVELDLGGLADQRAEIALVDQVADRDLVGDVGEQPFVALVQHAAVEPIGRGGKADHLEVRIDPRQRVEEPPVHGVGGARDQMRLVDQHQIALLHVVGAAVDRLDAGEQHLRADLALAQAGRVDAGRRIGPQPDHLGMVLRDQLAHMGDDQDALIGPLPQHALDEGRQHDRLAAGGRDHHQRMPRLVGEVVVDRRDGGLLIGAQAQHDAASRASLTQLLPSAIR